MHKRKQKALEAAGWKVGTTREFLDLTDEEAALVGIARGERAVKEGRTLSHASAKKRMARWLKQRGPNRRP